MVELLTETNYLFFAYVLFILIVSRLASEKFKSLLYLLSFISLFFTNEFISFLDIDDFIQNSGYIALSILMASFTYFLPIRKNAYTALKSFILLILLLKIFYVNDVLILSIYFFILKTLEWSLLVENKNKNIIKFKFDLLESCLFLGFVFFFFLSAKQPTFPAVNVSNYFFFYISLAFLFLVVLVKGSFFFFLKPRNSIFEMSLRSTFIEIFLNFFVVNALILKVFNKLLFEAEPRVQEKFSMLVLVIVVASISLYALISLTKKSTKSVIEFLMGINFNFAMIYSISSNEVFLYSEVLFFLLSVSIAIFSLLFVYGNYKTEENDLVIDRSFTGIFYKDKLSSFLVVISLMSLLGLPFTFGFSSRYFLLTSLFQEGFIVLGCLFVLAPVTIIPKLVSIIFEIFTKNSNEDIQFYSKIVLERRVIMMVLILALIVFGFYPKLFF